jgi:uncharacterized membrane protein YgdD (TMEM256/DUF423 family)
MPLITKIFLLLGSLSALLAVMLGAFGAHVLKRSLTPELMATYETAVDYHFYHTLGLLVVALLTLHFPSSILLKWSGWLMILGILIFSGSLYALSVSGSHWLGGITPLGGTAFITGWLMLILAVLKIV